MEGFLAMNTRELFNAIMHYEKVDRMPVIHWGIWDETLTRWKQEGLPDSIKSAYDPKMHEFLGTTQMSTSIDMISTGLYPEFEKETIEETDEYMILRQEDGVIAQHWKNKSCIPHYIDFTMKGPDWETGWAEYKKRLQPDPGRVPADMAQQVERVKKSGLPVTFWSGSLIGWIRNWIGVEGLSFLAYDNRDLLREMVDTITDCVLWCMDQIPRDVKFDCGWGWEDICFRTGPLLSPDIFREVATPNYRRIADALLSRGCDVFIVDCDGYIDPLIPHWLEGGVNAMFPLEIGVWKADPMEMRRKYGKELLIYGGIDKLEIARGREAIDAEIKRRIPIMKDGGFVPLPDHLIVPETSLDDYRYYIDRLRELRF